MATLVPEVPPETPRTGGSFTAWLGRSVLRTMGWRAVGTVPAVPKLVLIAAPHTSSWDFIIGLAVKFALRMEARYLAKDSLFRWPLSVLLNRTGGIPVDRSGRHNLVDQMAALFEAEDKMILAIAPEGTRSRVNQWKTGFYHIAHTSDVPILPVIFDYGAKEVRFEPTLHPTGAIDEEIARLRSVYAGIARRDD